MYTGICQEKKKKISSREQVETVRKLWGNRLQLFPFRNEMLKIKQSANQQTESSFVQLFRDSDSSDLTANGMINPSKIFENSSFVFEPWFMPLRFLLCVYQLVEMVVLCGLIWLWMILGSLFPLLQFAGRWYFLSEIDLPLFFCLGNTMFQSSIFLRDWLNLNA